MNKRLLVLILVFALVVGTAVADPAGMDFSLRGGVKGKACVVSYLITIRSGPGYLYDNIDEELASFSEGTELTVLSQVSVNGETWVQAEVPSSWGKIRAYLVAVSGGDTLISYSSGSVPWEIRPDELSSEWACTCYDPLAFRFGPGEQYSYTGAFLSTNDNAFVILTEGDWALVEATNRFDGVSTGLFSRRGWVRKDELIY